MLQAETQAQAQAQLAQQQPAAARPAAGRRNRPSASPSPAPNTASVAANGQATGPAPAAASASGLHQEDAKDLRDYSPGFSSDDFGSGLAEADMTEYERERMEQIQRNRARMQALAIPQLAAEVAAGGHVGCSQGSFSPLHSLGCCMHG